MNKKMYKILLFVPLLFVISCKENEHTIIKVDNSGSFEEAATLYNETNELEYIYECFETIEEDISTTHRVLFLKEFGEYEANRYYENTVNDLKVELPQRNVIQRKYVVDVNFGFITSGLRYPTCFATDSFSNLFESFLNQTEFIKADENFYMPEVLRIYTLDSTYRICIDGTVLVEFSDGQHFSSNKIDSCMLTLEAFNADVYGYETRMIEMCASMKATLKFNGVEKQINSLNTLYRNTNFLSSNPYRSYLFNTKKFDFSKMMQITAQAGAEIQYTFYISENGLIIREKNPFGFRFAESFSWLLTEESSIYYCEHIKNFDTSLLFNLFEE